MGPLSRSGFLRKSGLVRWVGSVHLIRRIWVQWSILSTSLENEKKRQPTIEATFCLQEGPLAMRYRGVRLSIHQDAISMMTLVLEQCLQSFRRLVDSTAVDIYVIATFN
jgi:hypothetical protein